MGFLPLPPRWCLVRVSVKDVKGESEVLQCTLWAGGVHKGYFHISTGMVVRGGEEAVHMPTSVTYVTEKHFFLVKGAVTHLTLCIIREENDRGGGERQCGPGRG